MRVSVKQSIQQQAIKNLLSAQKRIAEQGSGKEVVQITRYSLNLAEKFRDVFIDVGTESNEKGD